VTNEPSGIVAFDWRPRRLAACVAMAKAMVGSIMSDVNKVCDRSKEGRKKSWASSWLRCRRVDVVEPTQPPPEHDVTLVITPIGPRLPRKFQAYHSSVLLGDLELSFSMLGITILQGPQSHEHLPRSEESETRDMGKVRCVDAVSLRSKLLPHFRHNTYDLLRKNCNSFSDVCLFALVGARLDRDYRHLEQASLIMENSFGLIQRLTRGKYIPNPDAEAFMVEEVLAKLDGMAEDHALNPRATASVVAVADGIVVEA